MLTTNIEKHSEENCYLRILKFKNFQNLETFKEKIENFQKSPNFWEIFQKSKLHLKDADITSAHGKN